MASIFTGGHRILHILCFLMIAGCQSRKEAAVVIQTDFGLKDGAVASMKGVIRSVDAGIDIFDLTH